MQHELLAKKIRENLLAQKKRLTDYLELLDSEQKHIVNKDADKLLNHIKLEKDIIEELNNFKKILSPLEEMYKASPYKKDISLDNLRAGINKITGEVTQKAATNQNLLNKVIEDMRLDIKTKPKLNYPRNSYYNAESHSIDIQL